MVHGLWSVIRTLNRGKKKNQWKVKGGRCADSATMQVLKRISALWSFGAKLAEIFLQAQTCLLAEKMAKLFSIELILTLLVSKGLCWEDCHGTRYYNISTRSGSGCNCLIPNSKIPCATFNCSWTSDISENCTIYMLLDSTFHLDSTVVLVKAAIGITTYDKPVTIHCWNNGGFVLTSNYVLLRNLNFSGCSFKPLEFIQSKQHYPFIVTSAQTSLLLQYTTNVSITNCTFTNLVGSGITFLDTFGVVSIYTSNFFGQKHSLAHSQWWDSNPYILIFAIQCEYFNRVLLL